MSIEGYRNPPRELEGPQVQMTVNDRRAYWLIVAAFVAAFAYFAFAYFTAEAMVPPLGGAVMLGLGFAAGQLRAAKDEEIDARHRRNRRLTALGLTAAALAAAALSFSLSVPE